MTVMKQYNDGTSQWETIVVGKQGPQGETGETGVVVDSTPPSDTSVVWIDTSESGDDLSTSAMQTVEHGADANVARPPISSVYWKGSVAPTNGINGDLWYNTTGDA